MIGSGGFLRITSEILAADPYNYIPFYSTRKDESSSVIRTDRFSIIDFSKKSIKNRLFTMTTNLKTRNICDSPVFEDHNHINISTIGLFVLKLSLKNKSQFLQKMAKIAKNAIWGGAFAQDASKVAKSRESNLIR